MYLSQTEQRRLLERYGSWAVVTGASSGIGKEIAERLAESGFHLALVGRRAAELNETARQMQERHGIQTRVVEADVAKPQDRAALLEATSALDAGLFVASAGFGTSGLFTASSLEQELSMLEVNCAALLALTHHFAARFKDRKKGGIVLLSSMVAFQGVPFSAHYAATKAYVQSLAEALYVELQPFGVDVLAAAPGPVHSGFADVAGMTMGEALRPADVAAPILRALGKQATVLPGFLTKFLVYSLRTLPRWGKIRVMKLVMEGMTKNSRKG
jgi:short-subunit dehydrogenase